MDVSSAFVADNEASEAIQPREKPFHYPAVMPQFLGALDAPAGYPRLDAPLT